MRPPLPALALAACLALTGCSWGGKPRPQPFTPPTSAELGRVVSAHEGKDRAIVEEAAKIDAIAPEARPHTDAQRAAVAAAPAADVAALRATIDTLMKARTTDAATIADLRTQLEKSNSRTDQIIRLGFAGFGALLIAGAVIIALMAAKAGGVFVGVGPMQAGAIAAAGCTMLFASFAYGWALRNQTLVMSIFGACLVAAAVLWYSNRKHATAL